MVREAMSSGDSNRMEESSSALNDRLLNYAYLAVMNYPFVPAECVSADVPAGIRRVLAARRARPRGVLPMPKCPQCTKPLREITRRCPSCQADLDLLVDYVSHLQGGLAARRISIKAGELGQAIWAYLEVLEVDPDNPQSHASRSARWSTAVRAVRHRRCRVGAGQWPAAAVAEGAASVVALGDVLAGVVRRWRIGFAAAHIDWDDVERAERRFGPEPATS